MAPSFVLVYFDLPGAGEPIRWALEKAGMEWTDKRVTREEFAEMKPNLPNGQVPVLEVDGFQLPQSLAILRYVGRLGGLYPSDAMDAAKCDAIMDCAIDFNICSRPSFVEQDHEKKMALRADMADNFLPTWLANMEKQLSATDGTFFAEKMSVADMMITFNLFFIKTGILEGIPDSIVDPFPSLCAMYDAVVGDPKIAAFLAKHADKGWYKTAPSSTIGSSSSSSG